MAHRKKGGAAVTAAKMAASTPTSASDTAVAQDRGWRCDLCRRFGPTQACRYEGDPKNDMMVQCNNCSYNDVHCSFLTCLSSSRPPFAYIFPEEILFERKCPDDSRSAQSFSTDEGSKWLAFDLTDRALVPTAEKPSRQQKKLMRALFQEEKERIQSQNSTASALPTASTPAPLAATDATGPSKSANKRPGSPPKAASKKKAKTDGGDTQRDPEHPRKKSSPPGPKNTPKSCLPRHIRPNGGTMPAADSGPTQPPDTPENALVSLNPDQREHQPLAPQAAAYVTGVPPGASNTSVIPPLSRSKLMCDQSVQTDAVYTVHIAGSYMVDETQLFSLAARAGWVLANPCTAGPENLIDIDPRDLAAAMTAAKWRPHSSSQVPHDVAPAPVPPASMNTGPSPRSDQLTSTAAPASSPALASAAAAIAVSTPTPSTLPLAPPRSSCPRATVTAPAACSPTMPSVDTIADTSTSKIADSAASLDGSSPSISSSTRTSASSSSSSPDTAFRSNATGQLDTLWEGFPHDDDSSETSDFSC